MPAAVSKRRVKTRTWTGKSGKAYRYRIYKLDKEFRAVAGVYIFAKKNRSGGWTPIYVGETSDLSARFDNHHQQECIDSHKATHIHVHFKQGGVRARRAEERDIRQAHDPPCNQQ